MLSLVICGPLETYCIEDDGGFGRFRDNCGICVPDPDWYLLR